MLPFQKIFSSTLLSIGIVFSIIGSILYYEHYSIERYQSYEQVCKQDAIALEKEYDEEFKGSCIDGYVHAWFGTGFISYIALGIGIPSLALGFIWRLFLRRKHQ